jgi:hypothetical protein
MPPCCQARVFFPTHLVIYLKTIFCLPFLSRSPLPSPRPYINKLLASTKLEGFQLDWADGHSSFLFLLFILVDVLNYIFSLTEFKFYGLTTYPVESKLTFFESTSLTLWHKTHSSLEHLVKETWHEDGGSRHVPKHISRQLLLE